MAELELVCVPTRILTDNDDIVDAIVEFGGHNIGPEDIVCVAESVVVITQGRFTRPEELNVCWQARLINRFIHPDGSMASIYGMQSAMNLDGKWKVLGAFILGAIAKIFRKPGVFYAIARAASLTDDVTGLCLHLISTLYLVQRILIKWLRKLYLAQVVMVPL